MAVIFDFIGTLTNVRNYSMDDSKAKLGKAIVESGFDVSEERFLEAYTEAHEKYRVVRYQELVEVTNAVWISDALNCLGLSVGSEDVRIKTAVNAFFEDYIDSLELRPCAKELLRETSTDHRLGLISNFTYAPVIHAALRKLEINRYFNAILISEETGWRKPNAKIFREALRRLQAKAEETVYIGDSPLEDIKGAKTTGMKTVFVPSQFYTFEDLRQSNQEPDLVANDVCELQDLLQKCIQTNAIK